ncbi:peptidylprolyl isomerase [Bacillus sp. SA1-12]|uniref:SurA N-terminal domain-containing protein n=1 Tax=Bacillus sp. SA1-12 TaxID=1455638 RepID=UPI0006263A3A|nr:SurA N-terminal domain-containing protein [Bacillus sp. SA1-12]KKI94002.1 peptidylprolyl isomerase [Bacillus sp. SA1-12]
MKKFLLTLFIGLLAFSLAACNNDEDKKDSANTDKSTEEKAEEKAEEKTDEKQAAADAEEMQKKLEAQKVKEDTVVAIVNGQEIKGAEYNDALSISQTQFQSMGQDPTSEDIAKQLKDYTLESLVGQTLLMQEIEKKGYKATDEDINKDLETLKAQYKDEKAFNEALKQNNLTLDELKVQISDKVKYGQYIDKDLNIEEVTEKELKEYYDSMASQAGKDTETPKYEDVKEQLKLQLEQQKTQEKLAAKVEELRKGAKVELKI